MEKRSLACPDVVALLCDYVDGELLPSLQHRVQQHLLECSECAEILRGYRGTVEAARRLPSKEMSVEAQNRLRDRLNQKLGIRLPHL